MMTLMSGSCFSSDRANDSVLVNRVWDFHSKYAKDVKGTSHNVYLMYSFHTDRRNPLLYLVPTMYRIARGDRSYIGESYGKVNFRSMRDFDMNRQVVCGTIPRNRRVMPTLFEMTTPDLYSNQLYPERILSPFHRTNRFFYKYSIRRIGPTTYLHFRPRSGNTQLIKGYAKIDPQTGRIITVNFKGEFDMLEFDVAVIMNQHDPYSVLPERCTTRSEFKFLGNHIKGLLSSHNDCHKTLPDSMHEVDSLRLMKQLRPNPLLDEDETIYTNYVQKRKDQLAINAADTTGTDSINTYEKIKEIAWDVIGDHLINSTKASTGGASISVSPLFNPLYMSYSSSRGISYKLHLASQYTWKNGHYLTFNPQLGYSMKLKQFYYTLPIRMTYKPSRNGYVEIEFANGNRTGNAKLSEDFQKVMGDTIEMPYFNDQYVTVRNNINITNWLALTTGVVFHRRFSSDKELMMKSGFPTEYRSFAPAFTVQLTPWSKGPTLTANYERSISNVFRSNLRYERWEFDGVYKHQLNSVRILNLRTGAGFYTSRSTDYFVDFVNFRDNNLPTGWDDDWSGQFQVVDSRRYNESNYYLRGHLSYDSPLLMLSWVPYVGKFVETERVYLSAMGIEHHKPYMELGYGFKSRFFSTGIFAGFNGLKYQAFSCKFTIELFRRW